MVYSDMTSRVQIEGGRRGVAVARTLAEDLHRLREDAGVSQRALARASGIDQSVISRAEAGLEVPGIETYARLAAALGADLSARLYPNTGPAIRDRHQARIVEALVQGLHHRWRVWPEVGVRQPVRGWIDAVLVDADPPLAVATEVESSLSRLEQTIRWSTAKADALDSSRAWPFGVSGKAPAVDRLLVVRATRATRDLAAAFAGTLQAAYPADPWQALASLRGATHWPGPTLLWALERRGGNVVLIAEPSR
jgi:transcriptional regulator with XRE-family HTH domain